MPYSFHSHSGQFCNHGYGVLEDVIKEVVRKGFRVYGLSEHMPRYADSELYPEEVEAKITPETLARTYQDFRVEAKRLNKLYKDKICLLIGSEIEFINEDYAERIQQLRDETDYVVGSLHHVRSLPIDYSTEVYQMAIKGANNSLAELFVQYFDEQWVMLQTVRPEIVGHFDLIRIFADPSEANSALREPEVLERIVRNIDYVIAYGGLFEINSRAWKKGLTEAYPQKSIIEIIKSKGGKFSLSDDCHGPQDVGMFYEKLPAYLSEVGINTVHYLFKEGNKVVVKEHKNILEDAFWSNIQSW
ncbi:Polymerase/histidinol phosphatase-like protein [Sporodiniella umbellata]|nr:Polymerase/histidinol phosphatase-like protein [Sporodiniella umbellata]